MAKMERGTTTIFNNDPCGAVIFSLENVTEMKIISAVDIQFQDYFWIGPWIWWSLTKIIQKEEV